MDKFIELLKNAGVADTDGFMKQMKENKIHLSNEENIDVRYGKLKTDHEGLKTQLSEAQKTIDTLKASQTASEADKATIAEYERKVSQLNEQLKTQKAESALKVALLSNKAVDVDYLTFKLKEKGELELDEDGNVKGLDDKISGLKTQFPKMFETGSSSSDKKFDEKKLKDGEEHKALTKEEVLKMPYSKRAELFQKNPEQFKSIMETEN